MLQVKTAQIAHLDILEQVPDTFSRIEIRRISWQGFQVNVFGPTVYQERLYGLAAMDKLKTGDPVVLQLERSGELMYLAFTVE